MLHWLLCLSLKQSEWQSQPVSATRLLLNWLKSNQKHIVWKSPSFKISSWSFTVRPSNSCAALTQGNCKSLYSFRLIITKIQFLPCLPDLSVMSDKVKGGKKKKPKPEWEIEREPASLLVYSWAKLSHGRAHSGCARGTCSWQCSHYLGTGHFKEGPAVTFKPYAPFKLQCPIQASQAGL